MKYIIMFLTVPTNNPPMWALLLCVAIMFVMLIVFLWAVHKLGLV